MEVALFYIFIAICAIVIYKNRRKTDVGVLITASGDKYPYAIGDYLTSETSSFNGLDVTLPYSLTNFYLDSHKDSRRKGPAALYAKSQMVSLEGDFNKYFQLFVPPDSAIFALSVLSPDVMQTLITSSQRYDVELSGNHLRVITLEKTNKLMGGPLIAAAQAIIEELDHRAKSWRQGNAPAAKLLYRRGTSLKLASRYFRRSRLIVGVLSILLAVVAIGFGFALYYTHQDPTFSDPYSKGVFPGTMMYAAAAVVVVSIPIVMMAPFVWFFSKRPDKDIFPTK